MHFFEEEEIWKVTCGDNEERTKNDVERVDLKGSSDLVCTCLFFQPHLVLSFRLQPAATKKKDSPDRVKRSGLLAQNGQFRWLDVISPVELEPFGCGQSVQFIDNGLKARLGGCEVGLPVFERGDFTCDLIQGSISGL